MAWSSSLTAQSAHPLMSRTHNQTGGLPMFQPPPDAEFNGSGYDHTLDHTRLRGQIQRVHTAMRDGEWRTLGEIEARTGDPQASISAQLRHLRKKKFGDHQVDKRRRGDGGLWEYRLSAPVQSSPPLGI